MNSDYNLTDSSHTPKIIKEQYARGLSDYVVKTLENYLLHGLRPGGFMYSVLANDFMGAALRADAWNRRMLADIADCILECVPPEAYGNYATVDAWIEDSDGRRTKFYNSWGRQYVWQQVSGDENAAL